MVPCFPIICCNRRLRKLNIPLPTIEISSMNRTFSFLNFVLIVLSLSLSSVQYSNPLLAGILKAACNVFPLMLTAAFPVGAALITLISSGFSPAMLFRYLISASYSSFVTVDLPTPAPPDKKSLRGSSLVFTECNT